MSANDQREDLRRQSKELQNYCKKEKIEKVEVIEEVGSGMNYKKRGLKKLIKWVMEDKVEKIVLSYKDRLVRFGLEIIDEMQKEKRIVSNNKQKGKKRF